MYTYSVNIMKFKKIINIIKIWRWFTSHKSLKDFPSSIAIILLTYELVKFKIYVTVIDNFPQNGNPLYTAPLV